MASEQEAQGKKTRVPTAKKRDIQSRKKRLANKGLKSQITTATRKFEEQLQKKGPQAEVLSCLSEVHSLVDIGVKKGVMKLNKASRTKSRLTVRAKKTA